MFLQSQRVLEEDRGGKLPLDYGGVHVGEGTPPSAHDISPCEPTFYGLYYVVPLCTSPSQRPGWPLERRERKREREREREKERERGEMVGIAPLSTAISAFSTISLAGEFHFPGGSSIKRRKLLGRLVKLMELCDNCNFGEQARVECLSY